MIRKVALLATVFLFCGCGGVRRGVDVRITHGRQSWSACSLNVWHPYEDTGESTILYFIDSDGVTHQITEPYVIDYGKTPCY